MKSLKVIFLLFIALLSMPYLLHAQTISQDEFLDQLERSHPLFEKEKLTTQIEREEQDSYLGVEDWNVFSSISFSHENLQWPSWDPAEPFLLSTTSQDRR